jgi:hypothetical protein
MPPIEDEELQNILEAWETRPVVPVHIKSSGIATEPLSPEFAGVNNFTIPNLNVQVGLGATNFVQILQRRRHRSHARIWITSISGGGQQEVQISNPATGANASWTNTTGSPVQILTAVGTLTTDATAGNRSVYIQYKDAAGNNIARAQDTTAVVASSSVTIWGSQGGQSVNVASGNSFVPLPTNFYIPIGGSLVFTGVLDATDDNWTNIFFTYTSTSPNYVYIASDIGVIQNPVIGGAGFLVPASMIPFGGGNGYSWKSQRPCYATCVGGTAQISVIDESYQETIDRLE